MSKKSANKVVLAYSGGLDTSVIVPWLRENYGCEVICFCANLGQADEIDGLVEKGLDIKREGCLLRDPNAVAGRAGNVIIEVEADGLTVTTVYRNASIAGGNCTFGYDSDVIGLLPHTGAVAFS